MKLLLPLLLSFASASLSAAPHGERVPSSETPSPPANRKKVVEALVQLESRVKNGEDPDAVTKEVLAPLSDDEKSAFRKGLANALKEALAARKQESLADEASGKAPANQELGNSLLSGVDRYSEESQPKNPRVYSDSGADQFRMGNFQRSYDDYDRAIALGDRDPRTYLGYGEAAYRLGDYDVAVKTARAVLSGDPENQEALFLYHAAKDRPPVLRLPSSLGELTADFSKAGAMPSAGAASEAVALPTSGSGSFSGPPPSGMTAEQAAALARQASAPGSDAPARSIQYSKAAAAAMRVRDYPTAVRLASQAVSLNPQNAQALNYRAMSFSQMRRYEDAVQDASAALGLAPGNAAVLHTRSWAFSKQRKYKEALADAEAASAREPSNAFLYQDKALALAGLGDRPGALDSLRRSAALDPRFAARLERAVQLPQDSDMTLLFDDGSSPAAAPSPPGGQTRRFLRLVVLSVSGGLLIALGALHLVSARWREQMRLTVRRVLGPTPAAPAGVVDSASKGVFWTQYELVKEIGLGGMGVVYEALDRSLERRVAVKKMRDEIRLDPDDRRRFINEARLVAQLHHPSIVDIYGIVEDGADVYLVFEFVEGRTLQDALKSGGPMELSRARQVVKEMSDAVEHAHGRGIIHRDLKPSNVMLTKDNKVKVMDFGIARQAKDAATRRSMTNSIAGTPPYMAPEQEQGTVRKESDVYSLGVCLYEMTTGFLPFTGNGAAMLLSKLNAKLVPASQRNSSLPAGFDGVVARALDPDPDKRYRSSVELVAALDGLSSTAKAR